MQAVSQSWKDAHRKTIAPESYVEIHFKVGDPNAQNDATVRANGSEYFSTPDEIVNGTVNSPVPYATLEPGIWVLNGTRRIVGGPFAPVDPPDEDYSAFIPMGETSSMMTVDGQEFFVVGWQ